MAFLSRLARALRRFATEPAYRSEWRLRLAAPAGALQPYNRTQPDRYPVIFRRAAEALDDGPDRRILSFGCSTGEEVFSLRRYFPQSLIEGIDINPGNIAICERRLRRVPDPRVRFRIAATTQHVPDAAYDAIFCMAVLRHGALSKPGVTRADPFLSFAQFARLTDDFARCLKSGGLLVLRHSNFRFADAPAYARFEPLPPVPLNNSGSRTPLFGPDDRLMPGAIYEEALFRKRAC